jgi:hypothetical protein
MFNTLHMVEMNKQIFNPYVMTGLPHDKISAG